MSVHRRTNLWISEGKVNMRVMLKLTQLNMLFKIVSLTTLLWQQLRSVYAEIPEKGSFASCRADLPPQKVKDSLDKIARLHH